MGETDRAAFADGWRKRLQQWRRFNDWESKREALSVQDYPSALSWMTEARDLARRLGEPSAGFEEHVREIQCVRAALAKLDDPR